MATTAHSGVPAKAPSRKDLSGPALRTFFRIADAWDLKEAEQMKLLGLDSRSTFQTWKRGAVAAIPKDALERISYGDLQGAEDAPAPYRQRMGTQTQ